MAAGDSIQPNGYLHVKVLLVDQMIKTDDLKKTFLEVGN